VCGQCIKKRPYFDTVTANYLFEEPLRSLLHDFKYNQSLHLSKSIAKMMLQSIPQDIQMTECLIPVPIHPKRIRERGYNQAAELTKHLAKALKKPYELTLCAKIKNTAAQAGLSGKERLGNLHNAFAVKENKYKHITLVDDLITTGSTANELAKIFKKQGAGHVSVWCCARAF
jgi:ComF family protein